MDEKIDRQAQAFYNSVQMVCAYKKVFSNCLAVDKFLRQIFEETDRVAEYCDDNRQLARKFIVHRNFG